MCFSASASFIASASLGVIGIASIMQVKDKSQYALAGIPFIFAVQQLTEGFVWLSMTHEEWAAHQSLSSTLFLLFAQIAWPIWLPLSFYLFEKEKRRKKILRLFLIPGIMVAAYFLYCMFTYQTETVVVEHHIYYRFNFPSALIPYAAGFYLAATVAPPLFSKNGYIQAMGFIILIGYLVARVFFQPSLISVWCFFGIAIGVLIYLVVWKEKRNTAVVIPISR